MLKTSMSMRVLEPQAAPLRDSSMAPYQPDWRAVCEAREDSWTWAELGIGLGSLAIPFLLGWLLGRWLA